LFTITISNAQQLIVDSAQTNLIEFKADATLWNFNGITHYITGFMEYKNSMLTIGSKVNFKVDLDSIDTGIGLRNTHMRDNYLRTKKFPFAQFKGIITSIDTVSFDQFKLNLKGEFNIHGVSKPTELSGKFFSYGKLLKVESSFNLKLSDFDIRRPSFLFNTVNNNIKLILEFYLKEN